MNRMLAELGAWGCDVKGAMERMADDDGFYAECLRDVADDPYFHTLRVALEAGDQAAAFDAAHTLKGVFANMGLTPMYDKVVEIVEPLRGGSRENLLTKYDELSRMRERLNRILTKK